MTEFRLHIDIPLGQDERTALNRSTEVLSLLQSLVESGEKVQYRLGHDEDRQTSNYFQKSDKGHVSNKKSQMTPNISN